MRAVRDLSLPLAGVKQDGVCNARRALEVAAMSIYCHVATEMLRLSTPLGRGSRRRKEAMVWRLLCALRLHIGMRFLNARGKENG